MEFLKTRFKYDPETGLCYYIIHVADKRIGDIAGFIGAYNYLYLPYKDKQYKIHQFAFHYMTGMIPNLIDHINQIKTDNRWCNLRQANKSLNAFNSKVRDDNSSGHRGISFDKFRNKWRSYITINGKTKAIGRYDTCLEAMLARDIYQPYHIKNDNDYHSQFDNTSTVSSQNLTSLNNEPEESDPTL